MNFLAHAHLSPDDKDIRLGNFIADSIKGKKYMHFNDDIIAGILLHRNIDTYTDKHPIVSNSRSLVREHFGKFSGVVIDIYYDHFLARNWSDYSNEDLADYTALLYKYAASHFLILPGKIKRILPFMIAQNWLCGYANFHDLNRVFYGMDRRTGKISGMNNAIAVLKKNYDSLYSDFRDFYPDLQYNTKEQFIKSRSEI